MSNRWGPGGPEWIRVLDYGSAAAWVRPEDDGVSIAVYLGEYQRLGEAEIWVVRVLRGSSLLDTIMDKVHRIRWVSHNGRGDVSGVVAGICEDFRVIQWERHIEPASHQGHRRMRYKLHLRLDPLPRKIREAIGYP